MPAMKHAAVALILSASVAAAQPSCLSPPYDADPEGPKAELARLAGDLAPALAAFPSIAEAFEAAAPDLCVAEQLDGAEGYFDPDANRIVLRRGNPPGLNLAVLLHELRHVEQAARGFCPSTDLAMKENARASWAAEADASTVTLIMAWALREKGRPEAWDALLSWPPQSDITARFGQVMQETGDVETAAAGAFDQWYASAERREAYYIASCSEYLDRLEDAAAPPGYSDLPDDFFARLCILPGGVPFDCAEPDLPRR